MANRTRKNELADVHGRGRERNAARPLTQRELLDLRSRNVPHPGDRRRLAGIEELRRALHDRFEVSHG